MKPKIIILILLAVTGGVLGFVRIGPLIDWCAAQDIAPDSLVVTTVIGPLAFQLSGALWGGLFGAGIGGAIWIRGKALAVLPICAYFALGLAALATMALNIRRSLIAAIDIQRSLGYNPVISIESVSLPKIAFTGIAIVVLVAMFEKKMRLQSAE